MAERGKARYTYLSSGSNNVVQRTSGTLYGIYGSAGVVRIDDTHALAQGAFNFNASASNTVGYFPANTDLGVGIGLNTGLVVTFTTASNTAGITVLTEP